MLRFVFSDSYGDGAFLSCISGQLSNSKEDPTTSVPLIERRDSHSLKRLIDPPFLFITQFLTRFAAATLISYSLASSPVNAAWSIPISMTHVPAPRAGKVSRQEARIAAQRCSDDLRLIKRKGRGTSHGRCAVRGPKLRTSSPSGKSSHASLQAA